MGGLPSAFGESPHLLGGNGPSKMWQLWWETLGLAGFSLHSPVSSFSLLGLTSSAHILVPDTRIWMQPGALLLLFGRISAVANHPWPALQKMSLSWDPQEASAKIRCKSLQTPVERSAQKRFRHTHPYTPCGACKLLSRASGTKAGEGLSES